MKNGILISNTTVINAVTGVLFEMHPYHNPEGIYTIITEIEKHFDELDGQNMKNTFKVLSFDSYDEFYKLLKTWLNDIKEFNALNISRKLKDEGVVDIDDDRNKGFSVCDRYTVSTYDKRYTDFIDLDAAITNISNQILLLMESDDDCFLCRYAKEYGSMEPGQMICQSCICNPKMENRYEPHPMSLKPMNEWSEEEREMYEF